MQIIVNIIGSTSAEQEDVLFVDVSPDTTIATLKQRIEFQSAIPPARQVIHYNGSALLDDTKTMEQSQVTADSMLGVQVSTPQRNANLAAGPSRSATTQPSRRQAPRVPLTDPEQIRQQYLQSPSDLAQLRQQIPQMADAINDPVRWRQMWDEVQRRRAELQSRREQDIALLQADPFDVEAQKRIEERIRLDQETERLQQVDENLEQTREYHPEAFGKVIMLYVDVEVNSQKVKAFVDSGAQSTIMSPECAQRCGIMRLLDKRWSGIAKGVGTARILGRVHSAPIKIGKSFLASSFTVMEGKDVELLLGLDMLKRYQACIDLNMGVLRIQGDELPFLGEADIPKSELDRQDEPTLDGPEGTKIGGVSGAVKDTGISKVSDKSSNPPPASSNSAAQPASGSTSAPFPEADIAKLMEMGMGRPEAIQALTLANGNVDVAAGLFF